jgi:hypothetical protein
MKKLFSDKKNICKVVFVALLCSSIISLPIVSSFALRGGKFTVSVESAKKTFTKNEKQKNIITIENQGALKEDYLLYVELYDTYTKKRVGKGEKFPFDGKLPDGETKVMTITWEKPSSGWEAHEYTCEVTIVYMGGQNEDACINRIE